MTSRSGGFPKIFRRAASSAAFVPASPLPSTPAASSSQPSVRAGAGARIRDGPRVSDPGVGFKIASGSERVVSTSPASACARATTPGSRSRNRASSRTRNARSSAARASARVSASASPSAPSAPLSVARNAAPSMESVRVTSRAVTVAARARRRASTRVRRRRRPARSFRVLERFATDDARARWRDRSRSRTGTTRPNLDARWTVPRSKIRGARRRPRRRVARGENPIRKNGNRAKRGFERRATTHQRRRHRVVRTRGQRPRHQTTVGFG